MAGVTVCRVPFAHFFFYVGEFHIWSWPKGQWRTQKVGHHGIGALLDTSPLTGWELRSIDAAGAQFWKRRTEKKMCLAVPSLRQWSGICRCRGIHTFTNFFFFLGSKSLLEYWISSVFDQLLWELGGQDMGKSYYRITNTDRGDQ